MDLSGHTLLDTYGVGRVSLSGDYNATALADTMVGEWIPYWECHKCGRFDYCKFVQRYPDNPNRAKDIQCGVAETALRLFVEKTFPSVSELTDPQRQDYLDAAFYYSQFILDAEIDIGRAMNRDQVEYWFDLGPHMFTTILRLRELLDPLASKLRNLPSFTSVRPVLFVEGEAEKAFLDRLRESHSAWFLYLLIEVYGGSGNRRPSRIEMLLDQYVRRGYRIYIQGDADGRERALYNALIIKGLVGAENTFMFAHDFESSIPPPLLLAALQRLGMLLAVPVDAFSQRVTQHHDGIDSLLQADYDLQLDPYKVQLASMVGTLLNENDDWWMDPEFMATELGRFLRFVQHVH